MKATLVIVKSTWKIFEIKSRLTVASSRRVVSSVVVSLRQTCVERVRRSINLGHKKILSGKKVTIRQLISLILNNS